MSTTQPDGFLAKPTTPNGKAILVLHAWWGLNDTIKAFCKRLASEGYVVFAPDLYHGKVTDQISEAEALVNDLNPKVEQTRLELTEALMFLIDQAGAEDAGVAVIGFSLGAYYALDISTRHPEVHSVVLFYGTGPADFTRSKAAYLAHFAETDEFEPQSNIDELEQELKAAGRPISIYQYSDTGHWFFEPDRVQAYNPVAANLAWERTIHFLKRS